eukprot:m.431788 g.431788  ORF g.431788 m.431788 type:complete len:141 (+) comp17350_c0_seq1:7481-7903(+)
MSPEKTASFSITSTNCASSACISVTGRIGGMSCGPARQSLWWQATGECEIMEMLAPTSCESDARESGRRDRGSIGTRQPSPLARPQNLATLATPEALRTASRQRAQPVTALQTVSTAQVCKGLGQIVRLKPAVQVFGARG